MRELTPKQIKFADEYVITGIAETAALNAGYSKNYARKRAQYLLATVGIKRIIDERMAKAQSKNTASAQEVLEYLTSVMRNEITEEVIVVEGSGGGISSATTVDKNISAKDRNKAAELLGKRYRLFVDRVEADVNQVIIFSGENDLED